MFLTDEQVAALTGKKVRSAQARALNTMGITHKVRPDGSVAVLTSHVEKLLDGAPTAAKNGKKREPNWSAMNGPTP